VPDRNVKVKITGEDQASQVFSNIEGKLKSFGSALESLAIGEAVLKMAQFVNKGIEAGDQLAKLSEKTGVSVEALSGLAHAATVAGIGHEALEKNLSRLSKTMADAATGGKQSQSAFQSIGVAVTDTSGKLRPLEDVLGGVADKFQKAKDGPEKAAIAMKVFGKSGADMIPLLDKGSAGLAQMTEEAKKLGVFMSEEDAAAMEQFNQGLINIEEESKGLAQHFAEGLIPQVQELVDMLLGPSPEAFSATEAAGEYLGKGLKLLVLGIYALGYGLAYVSQKSIEFFQALYAAQTGDFKGALEHLKTFAGVTQDTAAEIIKSNLAIKEGELFPGADEERAKKALAKIKLHAKQQQQATADAMKLGQQEQAAILKAREALQEAHAQRMAAITKHELDLELAVLEELKTKGLVSTDSYYTQRGAIVQDQLNAELKALQKNLSEQQALYAKEGGKEKIETGKKIEETLAKIDAKQTEMAQADSKNDTDAYQAKKALRDFQLETEAMIQDGTRSTLAVKLDSIRKEFEARRKAVQAEGGDTAGLDSLEQMGRAKAKAEDTQQQIDQVYATLTLKEEAIRNLVATGQISELDGQEKINEAHKETADALQDVITKYEAYAKASGDPRLIQNVEALKQKTVELNQTQSLVRDDLRGGMMSSFDGFFTELIDGSKQGENAFANLGKSMLKMIGQLIVKLIMMQIILEAGELSARGRWARGWRQFQLVRRGRRSRILLQRRRTRRRRSPDGAQVQTTMVGETGPELLTAPSGGGNIVPNSQLMDRLGAAERPVTVQLVNQSSQPVTGQKAIEQIDAQKIVIGVMLKDMQTNGPYHQAQRQMFGK
jgi:hypothetical protein